MLFVCDVYAELPLVILALAAFALSRELATSLA